MNISKEYAWRPAGNCRGNNTPLPQSLRGLVIGKSGRGKTTVIFNLLLQPDWLYYNHLYVIGKSLHQQEYKVLRKGFEAGLSKHPMCSTVKRRWGIYHRSLPLKNTVVRVIERYELTVTMIARISQIRQMIVYKSRRIAVRRYQYRGYGMVSTIRSLLARYSIKAMLATAAKTALRGSLDAAKRAVPHLIAHKVVSTIATAARKRKSVDINVKHSQWPQSKKAFVDTGGIDINALKNGFGIVLD